MSEGSENLLKHVCIATISVGIGNVQLDIPSSLVEPFTEPSQGSQHYQSRLPTPLDFSMTLYAAAFAALWSSNFE